MHRPSVERDRRVVGDQLQAFGSCLSNEQPGERVTMVRRQVGNNGGMGAGHGELDVTVIK